MATKWLAQMKSHAKRPYDLPRQARSAARGLAKDAERQIVGSPNGAPRPDPRR